MQREFSADDGLRIFFDVYPVDRPRAAVQIAHGVGEHAGRYRGLAEHLVAEGYLVYADDHRGHGRTGMEQWHGDASKLGRLGPGGLRAALRDLRAFTRLIRDENPDLPLVILGHSWGSFLAQILVNAHPEAYDGIILSGSALRVPGALNAGDLNAKWKATDATGLAWLSSDLRVADEFVADPLTVATPLLRLFGPIDAARLFGRPRKDLGRDIPLLLIVGRDDPVGGPRSVHRLAEAYRTRSGFTDVTTLVYPDARHELFNEVAQAEVRADVIAWLDARFPTRG